METHRRRWLWLLIGGLLLPFAAYQSIIPLAAWTAPIFLLRFLRLAPRARGALLMIFAAYALSILFGMRGGTGTVFDAAVGLALLPLLRGFLYTLPYAADRVIGARLGAWPRLVVFPCGCVVVDWLMSSSRVTGTFGSPAYSQDSDLVLLQIVAVTGMWGLTFLIAWAAPTVNAAWERGFAELATYRLVAPFVLALVVVILFGIVRLGVATAPVPTVTVATISLDQAITSQASRGVDWATFNRSTDAQRLAVRPQFQATVDAMLARTATALQGGARLVSWQEGAGVVLEEDKPDVLERAAVLAQQYRAYVEIALIVATRTSSWPFLRNQTILLDPSGTVVWTYDKTHPVAGSEYLTVIAGPGVVPVADTPYGRMSTVICNDVGYPELVRQAGQHDADMLLVPTHDIIPYAAEDAAEAHFRAVENGVSLVRPTANGPSLITDPEGRILAAQDYFTTNDGILLGSIPTRGVPTIYRQIGDIFAYLCVLGLVALTGWALRGDRAPAAVLPLPQPS